MSPIQFLRILIARRWIIGVTFVTCVVVALGVAKMLPERYPARARVMLDLVKPDPVTGQMAASRDSRSYIKTQIEIIQDFRVTGEVVDRLGWAQNPAVIAAWQADTGGVGDIRRWGAQKISANTSAATWYREQADAARKVLNSAEEAKNRFEQAKGLVMTAGGQESESTKLASLQQALVTAQGGEASQQFQATVRGSTSSVVDSLKVQLATLNDQIEQAAEKLGTEHPTYKSGIARRALLMKQLATETAAAQSAGAQQSSASKRSVSELQGQYEAQKLKVLSMKDELDQLAQLQREVDLRRSQYEKAAARTADLQLESNVSESGLVILGDAVGGQERSFPIWSKIIGLASVFGLGLGVVLAVLTELYARRIRGPEDLRFASKVPVLAVIADTQRSPFRDRIRRLLSRGTAPDAPLHPAQ